MKSKNLSAPLPGSLFLSTDLKTCGFNLAENALKNGDEAFLVSN